MHTSYFSLGFSLFYVICIGFLVIPQGIGASLVVLPLLAYLCASLKYKNISQPTWLQTLVLLSACSAAMFTWTTNSAILLLNTFQIVITLSLLMLANSLGHVSDDGALGYLSNLMKLIVSWLRQLPRFDYADKVRAMRTKEVLIGIVLSLVPLFVFFFLLGKVNQDYRIFMESVLQYFWDLEIVQQILEIWVLFHLLYTLLNLRFEAAAQVDAGEKATRWLYALAPSVLAIVIFIGFQIEYLSIDFSSWPFKQLSLYTQTGYWELVWAAIFGYGLWCLVWLKGSADSETSMLPGLLAVFCIELFILGLFSLHKIISLQWLFGLKDTRLLATAGVMVVMVTFISCLIVHLRRLQLRRIFTIQLLGLSIISSLFTVANVESLITRFHPIQYTFAGKQYKDLSYLLTNSYDNYSEWGELMLEGLESNIPLPDNYYWGNYKPLCHIEPSTDSNIQNHLKKFHEELKQQFDRRSPSLRHSLKTNIRKREVYQWLTANRTLVNDFYQAIEQACKSKTNRV